jgi:hypothetical protein
MYNEKLDFIHNIYGFLFCVYMFFLSMTILFNQNNLEYMGSTYLSVCKHSYIYFTISSGINYLDKNNIFLLHHIICMVILFYGYLYMEPEYLIWVSKTFLAEFSTIFLSLSKILRYVKKNSYVPDNLITFSDNFFIISYFSVRVMYLLPLCLLFIINYRFRNIFGLVIPLVSIVMIGMNIYWTFLIYKKVTKNIDHDKFNSKKYINIIKKFIK